MTILTTPKHWRRAATVRQHHAPDLTVEEVANVRAALRFLRARLGGGRKLAAALRVPCKQVEKLCSAKGRPGAGMAIRVARTADVPIEHVLSGAFPPPGACPHCGRITEPG